MGPVEKRILFLFYFYSVHFTRGYVMGLSMPSTATFLMVLTLLNIIGTVCLLIFKQLKILIFLKIHYWIGR